MVNQHDTFYKNVFKMFFFNKTNVGRKLNCIAKFYIAEILVINHK